MDDAAEKRRDGVGSALADVLLRLVGLTLTAPASSEPARKSARRTIEVAGDAVGLAVDAGDEP